MLHNGVSGVTTVRCLHSQYVHREAVSSTLTSVLYTLHVGIEGSEPLHGI